MSLVDSDVNWKGAACYTGRRPDWSLITDPRLFDAMPPTGRVERHEIAKTYCKRCPLTTDCLIYAVKNKLSGTYGGVYVELGQITDPPQVGRPKEEVPA